MDENRENRIPLKTDGKDWAENDFVQTELGTIKELLVTITLHEYRELVEMKQYNSDRCNALLRENAELKKKLADALINGHAEN